MNEVTETIAAPPHAAAPEPFRRVAYALKGGEMAGIMFGSESASPDIVFLHATGFNARAYRTLLAPMGDRHAVLALDFRGHGRSTLPAKRFGYVSWRTHRDDVLEVIEKNFTRPVTLAGHSLGATVALLAGAKRGDLIASLALIEPVILPAAHYAFMEMPLGPLLRRWTFPLARAAAARRANFPDRQSAMEAFAGRGVFKTFSSEAIADYVGDGLVEDERAGGFRLACSPHYEAATFCAQRHDPWAALRAVHAPLVLLRAEKHSTMPPAALHRFSALKPEALVATVEGATHMLPMERPDRVRAAIEAAALRARGKRGRADLD